MKVTKKNFREITMNHIVVGIMYGEAVIWTSQQFIYSETGNSTNVIWEARTLGDGFQRGNGYDISKNLNNSLEYYLENPENKFYAYPESEWKKALRWLVRNG